jgi:hypothetical protein
MSALAWKAILDAWAAANALLQKRLPSGGSDGEACLARIHEELSTRWLPELRSRLQLILTGEARQGRGLAAGVSDTGQHAAEASAFSARVEAEVEKILGPLAVHLDERVLTRLPPQLGPSWTRLQESLIQSDDGGLWFYESLEGLLRRPPQAPDLVLEVYLFCLCEGFSGRYIDEPDPIADYKKRIARRLPAQHAKMTKRAGGEDAPREPPKVLPAPVYYIVAVVAALLSILLLRALAH